MRRVMLGMYLSKLSVHPQSAWQQFRLLEQHQFFFRLQICKKEHTDLLPVQLSKRSLPQVFFVF